MTWEDLDRYNIEEVKNLYIDYINDNKESNYVSNLMTFEEFINKELRKCNRCDNIIFNDNEYCECCHDDLFEIPEFKGTKEKLEEYFNIKRGR